MKNSSTQSPDEKPINSKSESSGFEGEIKIDHSIHNDKAENPAENILDKSIQSEVPVSKPTTKPAHEKHIEPLHQIPPIDESLQVENITQAQPVHVPGGVTELPQNPDNFFNSKYHGRRNFTNGTQDPTATIPNTNRYPLDQIYTNSTINGQTIPTPISANSKKSFPGKKALLYIITGIAFSILLVGGILFFIGNISSNPETAYRSGFQNTNKALLKTDRNGQPLFNQIVIIDNDGSDRSSFSSEDIASITSKIAGPLSEYVFTDSVETAIFANFVYIGEESNNDQWDYRYSAIVDQVNFDKFCSEVSTIVTDNQNLNDIASISPDDGDVSTKLNDFCKNLGSTAASDYDVDIWVSKDKNVVTKIRFTNKTNQDSYTEFSNS